MGGINVLKITRLLCTHIYCCVCYCTVNVAHLLAIILLLNVYLLELSGNHLEIGSSNPECWPTQGAIPLVCVKSVWTTFRLH